jgi:hypothetical protein
LKHLAKSNHLFIYLVSGGTFIKGHSALLEKRPQEAFFEVGLCANELPISMQECILLYFSVQHNSPFIQLVSILTWPLHMFQILVASDNDILLSFVADFYGVLLN